MDIILPLNKLGCLLPSSLLPSSMISGTCDIYSSAVDDSGSVVDLNSNFFLGSLLTVQLLWPLSIPFTAVSVLWYCSCCGHCLSPLPLYLSTSVSHSLPLCCYRSNATSWSAAISLPSKAKFLVFPSSACHLVQNTLPFLKCWKCHISTVVCISNLA